MLRVDYKKVMGTITVAYRKWKLSEDGKSYAEDENGQLIPIGWGKYSVDICWANALCAFISKWKDDEGNVHRELYSFFADTTHANRCVKHGWIKDNHILSAKLNIAYPDARSLLPIFAKGGLKVTAYYKPLNEKGKRK